MRPLDEIARDIVKTKEEEERVKRELKNQRDEFFEAIASMQDEAQLPTHTIEVPNEFFQKTGAQVFDFVFSRFPGWSVESVHHYQDRVVITLKRGRDYIEGEVVVDGYKVSKSISEFTPEIDWETLSKEHPDIAEDLAKPVVTWEIDEEVLGEMVGEIPELPSILERHMKVKAPTQKLTRRKVSDGE